MVQSEKKVIEIFSTTTHSMVFILQDKLDIWAEWLQFDGQSKSKKWDMHNPPQMLLQSYEQNQKNVDGKMRIVPDIGNFNPGDIILSKMAAERLENFWLRFGELLPLDVEGVTYFYYNVTNVIENAVDFEKSIKGRRGQLRRPAFIADAIPDDLQIFKIPEQRFASLYVSGHGFTKLIQEQGLKLGVYIFPVWSPSTGVVPQPSLFEDYSAPPTDDMVK